jgi:ankyrin repeat protein
MFLLNHGANVNDTPFEVLESDEYAGSVEELLSPLGWAISNRNEEMVGLLMRHGAEVLATAVFDGFDSQNGLTYAIWKRSDLDLTALLLANVKDLKDCPGWEDALKISFED